MKCTCGHDKDIHFKGVSTCLNHGRCLCALYTPVDPQAEVEVAWANCKLRLNNHTYLDEAMHRAFIAGWEARSC